VAGACRAFAADPVWLTVSRTGATVVYGKIDGSEFVHPVHLRFGGYQAPASIHNRAATAFGAALRARVGDRVAFELVGNVLDLGRQSGDLPKMVAAGELALCYISTVRFSAAVPELGVFELPFVVRDRAAAHRAFAGPLGRFFSERMAARTPYRLLGLWDNGFRHLTNRVRPIRLPADCRGLRIRTQMSALQGESFRALGFEPVPADVKEFVEQIAGDRFEAQDNPLTNTWNFGVHRYHRYFTQTGHFFGASGMVINAALFASLPADLQGAIDAAAEEATREQWRLAAAEDEAILARIDPAQNEIFVPGPVEHAAFVEAVAPVLARHQGRIDARVFEWLAAA
jgi:TRAP-type C4-dicarboxylate transport system substrate-binding protein